MTHGLQINNSSGGLVVDADLLGMHYVGQASFLLNTSVTNNAFFRNRTRRRYAVTLPSTSALPLAMVKPQADRWVSIEYVQRASAGSPTWYIDLFSADSSMLAFNVTDMTSSASAEVHVFSTHAPTGGSHGLHLFDQSGNLTWNFSAGALFIRQVLEFPSRTDRGTYRFGDSMSLGSGITNPWVANVKAHGKDNMRIGANGTHEDSEYVFQTDGAGNLKRVLLGTYRETGDSEDPPYSPQPDWALPPRTVFVVDGGDYT